jgi:Protein of unknown function (DUF2905)
MATLGRMLLLAAAGLAAAGLLLLAAARLRLPLGHLPGDIVIRGKHTTIYIPWVTMLILSALLTLLLRLLRR